MTEIAVDLVPLRPMIARVGQSSRHTELTCRSGPVVRREQEAVAVHLVEVDQKDLLEPGRRALDL